MVGAQFLRKTLWKDKDYVQTRVTNWASKIRKVEVHLENYDEVVYALSISIVEIKPDKYHASPIIMPYKL